MPSSTDRPRNAPRPRRHQVNLGRPRRVGLVETFEAIRMTSADWEILRHRVTNEPVRRVMGAVALARFPDGHCQATPVTFGQAAERAGFSRTIVFDGIGGNQMVPCAVVEAAAADAGWQR